MKEASPRPWGAEEVGIDEWFLVSHDGHKPDGSDGWWRIGEIENKSDIDLIVRAVNAHDAIVAALKKMLDRRRAVRVGGLEGYDAHWMADIADAALRLAGELE